MYEYVKHNEYFVSLCLQVSPCIHVRLSVGRNSPLHVHCPPQCLAFTGNSCAASRPSRCARLECRLFVRPLKRQFCFLHSYEPTLTQLRFIPLVFSACSADVGCSPCNALLSGFVEPNSYVVRLKYSVVSRRVDR